MKYHLSFFLLREESDACNRAPRHHHVLWICCEFLSVLVPLLFSVFSINLKKAKIARYTLEIYVKYDVNESLMQSFY